jgi:hypothetical protein
MRKPDAPKRKKKKKKKEIQMRVTAVGLLTFTSWMVSEPLWEGQGAGLT